MRDFANAAHQIRNTVYHQGVRDEPILWSLAWHYHELACDVFAKLQQGWMGAPMSESTRLLMAYGDQALSPDERLTHATGQLRAAKPACDRTLGQVLSDAMCARLAEMDDTLNIAAPDGPNVTDDLDGLIRDAVFREQYDFCQSDDGEVTTQAEFMAWHERRAVAKAAFQPHSGVAALKRWAKRAQLLASSETTRALVQYQCLERDITPTEQALNRLAWEIDEYNDQAIQEWKENR